MAHIEIDDRVFKAAQRRAVDGGYSTVEEYIADVVAHDLVEDDGETPNLDHLFKPQRLAEIEQAAADVDSGKFFTADQVREHFEQKRAAWTKKNGNP